MIVGQNAEEPRRGRGRPPVRSEEETRRLMIEAASHDFQAKGYAGASMNAVAQRAGVSTKTMYRLIPTKADLLRAVMSDRIGRFMLEIDAEALEGLPIAEALIRLLAAYGTLVLSAETVAIQRLIIAECDRFPEIATAFYELAIVPTAKAMADWLQRQCERGLITLDDPEIAAGLLRGMMIFEPQRAVMMGQRSAPGPEEIAARAAACARLFLAGCAT